MADEFPLAQVIGTDGFNTIVIATDSAYAVDGATNWTQGWIPNGWKARIGEDVKNRDLLELFLWKIPR
jgi:ribonuclease HI